MSSAMPFRVKLGAAMGLVNDVDEPSLSIREPLKHSVQPDVMFELKHSKVRQALSG